MTNPTIRMAPSRVDLEDLVAQSARAMSMMDQVRGLMLSPSKDKVAPDYSASAVATLCGIEKSHLNYRLSKGDLPQGSTKKGANRRSFSLAEARTWVKAFRTELPRPAGAHAATVAIGNFKGGVSKTTTTMTLAQGLSLRGYDVLVVDMDPQGSLTTLFGVIPDTEVEEEVTVGPLIYGQQSSIRYAIHESYWDGVDFVPANSQLFNAEFYLPTKQVRERSFEFWNVLNRGLDDVREMYDVILIDTAPALSYLTINAFMAADGLLVPLPPSALDFASSVQFWSLFSDLAVRLNERASVPKVFDFVHILLARVDPADEAGNAVRKWILSTYAEKVLPVEIPKTAVASASAAEFGTVYDIAKYEGDSRTYQRARVAYDRVCELLDQILVERWSMTPLNDGDVVETEASAGV